MTDEEEREEQDWLEKRQQARHELEKLTRDELMDRLSWYMVELSEMLPDAVVGVKAKFNYSQNGHKRWENDPKTKRREEIHAKWLEWRQNPQRTTQAEFISELCQKDLSLNDKVVGRWCVIWKKSLDA